MFWRNNGNRHAPELPPAVQYHDQLARQWEAKYEKPAFAAREHLLTSRLEGLVRRSARWLDAGCGTGRIARWLAARGCLVDAVDGSHEMLSVASAMTSTGPVSREPMYQHIAKIERLPFPDGCFDGVLCTSVIEYLPDPEAAMAEFARIIKPHGHLMISVPNRLSILRRLLVAASALSRRIAGRSWPAYMQFSRHEYSRQDLVQCLDCHQFVTRETLYFGGPGPAWLRSEFVGGSLILAVASRAA
jgi:2-polyprenyl-3-methyl-5-hydroxy-6-metoxy-1,4-benzoquinol methylase